MVETCRPRVPLPHVLCSCLTFGAPARVPCSYVRSMLLRPTVTAAGEVEDLAQRHVGE